MKKIILFLEDVLRKRGGGPSSYLYNLKLGLEKIGHTIDDSKIKIDDLLFHFVSSGVKHNIDDISPDVKQMKLINILGKNHYLIKKAKTFLSSNSLIYFIFALNFRLKKLIQNHKEDLKKADAIWFQDPLALYYSSAILKSSFNKKFLTIHSPDDLIKELYNVAFKQSEANTISKLIFKFFPFKKYERINLEGIRLADYFIYSAKDCLEIHFKSIPIIKEIFDLTKEKFLYSLPGAPPLEIHTERQFIRKQLGINQNDVLILFIGRHNEYKGFDILFEVVKELRERYKNLYLISAGKGHLVEKYKSTNFNNFWKYLGFIENVGDLINACDVHIIPNRESYFDIGLIESLSVGRPIITTYTGGHKFFKDKSRGLILIEPDKDNLKQTLISFIQKIQNKNYLNDIINDNKKLYNDFFTIEKFAERVYELFKKFV